jgi:hypothetical protein
LTGVRAAGINRIEYRPWKGKRTDPNRRLLVISENVLRRNLASKGVLLVLIVGLILVHIFSIIGAVFFPHAALTDADMIGGQAPTIEPINATSHVVGDLEVNSTLLINGSFAVMGNVSVGGSLLLAGSVAGNGTIVFAQGVFQSGNLTTNGSVSVSGHLIVNGSILGMGTISGTGWLNGTGFVTGNVTGGGAPTSGPEFAGGGYLTSGLLVIFTMLLAAVVCSDIIADDMADSSFVLYFSRPVRTIDYFVGKFTGAALVMGLFCVLPPMVYALVMLGTQTGSDYGGGLVILGKTILAGVFTAVFFLPFGLLVSSLTERKAYAGVGIFMSFFVLTIISGIFSNGNIEWLLVDPFHMVNFTFTLLFGGGLPSGVHAPHLAVAISLVIVVPLIAAYFWIGRKGAGK